MMWLKGWLYKGGLYRKISGLFAAKIAAIVIQNNILAEWP